MNAAAVVAIKTNNRRLSGKNTMLLGGRPLYQYTFEKLYNNKKLKVYVDSSNDNILLIAKQYNFETIKRPKELDSDETTGFDLLDFELKTIQEPIIVQTWVTIPFVTNNSINESIEQLETNNNIDSVVALHEIQNRFWYDGKPVNHDPSKLLNTQDMKAIYCETGFYTFRREAYLRERRRITEKHGFMFTSPEEGIDIDTKLDFLYASAYLKEKGLS